MEAGNGAGGNKCMYHLCVLKFGRLQGLIKLQP